MKTILVKVTRADIRKGLSQNGDGPTSETCPVAQSLHRMKRFKNADVWFRHVVGRNYKIKLPRSAADFILKFDMKKPVKPFSFRLRVE